jgi:hypothetical protein
MTYIGLALLQCTPVDASTNAFGFPKRCSFGHRIRACSPAPPWRAQCLHGHIFNIRRRQAAGQCGAVELWVMARMRDRADVRDAFDAISSRQGDETIDWQCRMPECEHSAFRSLSFLQTRSWFMALPGVYSPTLPWHLGAKAEPLSLHP